jgi:TetR/AcrR family fatty acid metabolism transcriptional regulator
MIKKPKYSQIIDAAVTVIAENGYHHAKVTEIAKQASVADGTIYLYFKNKEDILISLFEQKMGQFIGKIATDTKTKQNASEKLLALIGMHFHQLAADHHLAVVTQLELRQSNKDIRYKINQVLKPYLTVIDNVIEEGKSEGIFCDDLNIPLARQMVFGTMDEAVTNWVMQEQKYDLEKLAPEVHKLLVSGLCS